MSLAKAKAAANSTVEKVPEAKNDDAPKPESPKDIAKDRPLSKFSLGKKLSSFRRKLNAYTRFKERVLAALKGDKEKLDDDSKEEKPVSKVLESYRLLRNFCLTYNWVSADFPANRGSMLTIPEKFEPELKKLLSEEILTKFLEAMQG